MYTSYTSKASKRPLLSARLNENVRKHRVRSGRSEPKQDTVVGVAIEIDPIEEVLDSEDDSPKTPTKSVTFAPGSKPESISVPTAHQDTEVSTSQDSQTTLSLSPLHSDYDFDSPTESLTSVNINKDFEEVEVKQEQIKAVSTNKNAAWLSRIKQTKKSPTKKSSAKRAGIKVGMTVSGRLGPLIMPEKSNAVKPRRYREIKIAKVMKSVGKNLWEVMDLDGNIQ